MATLQTEITQKMRDNATTFTGWCRKRGFNYHGAIALIGKNLCCAGDKTADIRDALIVDGYIDEKMIKRYKITVR